ncbi:pentatricopeptide repeat-containing protein At1g08070, chloroplastic-like [Rhodamnia argentea]|uniref:Pentatricopeptide repeat-containing protein At1g08070, chloroplastic-like n=1 Tax=Rhodamnia argentea TaxID=178133 RepID=A0A8B8MU47_9MYRT|nr:pentatricopeptide repeat-containing protein At1g08070, chloroplastic-like [Rhodamnia argentea]
MPPKLPCPRFSRLLNSNTIDHLDPFQEIASRLPSCKHATHLNQIHAHLITTGFIRKPIMAGKLIASLSASSSPSAISAAHSLARRTDGLDSFTWNTVIRGYLERSDPQNAILVYSHLRGLNMTGDSYTVLFVIKACGLVPAFDQGKLVHAQIFKLGFVLEIIVQTALLNMYVVFDEIQSMRKVFDEMPLRDLVAWNSLIAAYSGRNYPKEALEVVRAMVCDNVTVNEVTAVSILSACSLLKTLGEGKSVHSYLLKTDVDLDVFVQNALMGMYSKSGSLSYACRIFHSMATRNVVSWTTMINGYACSGYFDEAFSIYRQMDSANVRPDEVTLLSIISVCSELGSSELGEWITLIVEKSGPKRERTALANALMRMHTKCGNILKACQIFDGMKERTLITWTTMIQGLAIHGHGVAALMRFVQMQRQGLKPDGVVFLCVLFACSHAGLIEHGRKCFNLMIKEYDIKPWMEHCGCMVDLLCRAGLVDEAFDFVANMPVEPDMILWRMLLVACQNQGRPELVSQVMHHIHELGPKSSEDYVLMSNLCASVAEWDVMKKVRDEMKQRGVSKEVPGSSFLEVHENVHRS